ncbi:unnamed protein product [marine sediment metagenome]|uniref:Uncharacterized protein n=1 Tax=marine sediment metagenome TaxID=412755 RepID=X1IWS8_9ZZZZ
MMVEYTLDVGDNPEPESRLEFLKKLEAFLRKLKDEEIIVSYTLSTPNSKTIIFREKEETK